MNYRKDCKHFRFDRNDNKFLMCAHPNLSYMNPVTGLVLASAARSNESHCGLSGHLFEKAKRSGLVRSVVCR